MKQNEPIVSVLMTAYNREKYIAEAIESVLASTYNNFELIIVDDCSKDKTVDIARHYEAIDKRVKVYVNEKNLGDYTNRNRAASYAKGKYIKYLDSDDVIYPHCLQVMVDAMEKFPMAGYGLSAVYDAKGPYPSLLNPHDAYIEHFYGFGHFNRAPGSSIIRRDVFEEVERFSTLRHVGDSDMWYKLSLKYDLIKLPQDLYWARIHPGQELQTETKNKKFQKIRKDLIYSYIMNKNCPLSEEEKSEIKKLLTKRYIKAQMGKLLKLFRFGCIV